jgi:ASPIC and UnbV/FG-GAP-like repeat
MKPGATFRGWALALGLAASTAFAAGDPAPALPKGSEAQTMAALLKQMAAAVDPARLSFIVNDKRVDLFRDKIGRARSLKERLEARFNYADELLKAGRVQDSVEALDALETDTRANAPPAAWTATRNLVLMQRGLAYMRLAEEQNCHAANTPDSCLFPIRGQGIHTKREGSTRAIELFGEVLAAEPSNLRARWLLNVAHMTLGSYPGGVPADALIPPSSFASEYALPEFHNVARSAGVDLYGLAGGAVLEDFDGDGRLDLLISHMGLEDQLRYLRNSGDGTFEDRTAGAGIEGEVGGLNMVQADYDNDGHVDVLVLRGGWMGSEGKLPMSLLRNKGDGTFEDVTRAAGLLHLAPTQTATWLDYDGDGWLDLFVGNETSPGARATDVHPCELFHNNKNGTFTNMAHEAGVDVAAFVKAVVSGDYDNDGRPDLYLSIAGGRNRLFRNEGPTGGRGWRFADVTERAGVAEPESSFGVLFFDYDNDGFLDLFVAGYGSFFGYTMTGRVAADYLGLPNDGERGRLYHNKGDGTFEDVTRATGLYRVVPAMGLNFGDLDNDGWLDLYLGTGAPDFASLFPNRMFRNSEGHGFQDVTTAGNFGHIQKGHAICFGDVDNDGDQDIFEEMGGAYTDDKAFSALYENPGNSNHWITLSLEGVRSNRSAIGARVKVEVEGVNGVRRIYRTVGSGGSFGASPLRQEIGLGDARRIDSVEVRWPATGRTQKLEGLRADHAYRVKEDDPAVQQADVPRFTLRRPAADARAESRPR